MSGGTLLLVMGVNLSVDLRRHVQYLMHIGQDVIFYINPRSHISEARPHTSFSNLDPQTLTFSGTSSLYSVIEVAW